MKLVDYEKYYHSGSEFIIPRDEFEKIIEENQRLNNVIKFFKKYLKEHECYEETALLEQLESEPYDENWNGWKVL